MSIDVEAVWRQWETIADVFLRREYDDVVTLLDPLPDEAKLALYCARAALDRREIAVMADKLMKVV